MATIPRIELEVQSTTELDDVSVSDARFSMAELFNQVHYGNARVYLTRHGKRFVAIIPAALLEAVERKESERRGQAVAAARTTVKPPTGETSEVERNANADAGEEMRNLIAAARAAVAQLTPSTLQEPKAVVERGLKAFNAHDLAALARDAAPDIEGTAPGDVRLKGPQAFMEFNQNFITAFPDARIEARKVVTDGGHVVVEGVFTGTHAGTMKTSMGDVPPTGRKVKSDYIQIYEIASGLVKKANLMYDQVELMNQLLGTEPAPLKHAVETTE